MRLFRHVHTQWTETRAVFNRGPLDVKARIAEIASTEPADNSLDTQASKVMLYKAYKFAWPARNILKDQNAVPRTCR